MRGCPSEIADTVMFGKAPFLGWVSTGLSSPLEINSSGGAPVSGLTLHLIRGRKIKLCFARLTKLYNEVKHGPGKHF